MSLTGSSTPQQAYGRRFMNCSSTVHGTVATVGAITVGWARITVERSRAETAPLRSALVFWKGYRVRRGLGHSFHRENLTREGCDQQTEGDERGSSRHPPW
jgi:hypothetical protein